MFQKLMICSNLSGSYIISSYIPHETAGLLGTLRCPEALPPGLRGPTQAPHAQLPAHGWGLPSRLFPRTREAPLGRGMEVSPGTGLGHTPDPPQLPFPQGRGVPAGQGGSKSKYQEVPSLDLLISTLG